MQFALKNRFIHSMWECKKITPLSCLINFVLKKESLPCLNVWHKKSPTWGKIQYHPWIKHEGYENKGNDHQIKKLMIVIQTLLVSVLRNVYKTVWRICILMLGRKEDMTERRREWSDLPIRSQTLASPGLSNIRF